MPLQHTLLDPARSEIRTLTLISRHFDDIFHYTSQAVSLDEDTEFEALSYLWGRDRGSKEIFVDDQACSITVSLDEGLRRLILKSESGVLWVDTFCINQKDIKEKTSRCCLWDGCIAGLPESSRDWVNRTPSVDVLALYMHNRGGQNQAEVFQGAEAPTCPQKNSVEHSGSAASSWSRSESSAQDLAVDGQLLHGLSKSSVSHTFRECGNFKNGV